MSELPNKQQKSEQKTIRYFDTYYEKNIEVAANEFDATNAFFVKRGFGELASLVISQVLLTQAKLEKIKIFQLLDGLRNIDRVQLNFVIAKILNQNRSKTSKIGYNRPINVGSRERQNIIV